MHILPTISASLDDLIEPVDLRQAPADIVSLSFTDSDLAGIAAAWKRHETTLPSMRLAALRDLRHPLSVDLWLEKVATHAKVILVRILGGYEWWRYGCDQLAALARTRGIKLALLPGECREQDERLVECSTLPREELDALLAFFREGGPGNMDALVRQLAGLAQGGVERGAPVDVPKAGFYFLQNRKMPTWRLTLPTTRGRVRSQQSPSFSTALCCSLTMSPPSTRFVPRLPPKASGLNQSLSPASRDPEFARVRRGRSPRPGAVGDHHSHGFRRWRRARCRHAVRSLRRSGVPGHRRHNPTRRMGKERARAAPCGSGHACRHAGT